MKRAGEGASRPGGSVERTPAGGIVHDLNNILGVVLAAAAAIAERIEAASATPDEATRADLAAIAAAAAHGRALLRRGLEAERTPAPVAPLPLDDAVRGMSHALRLACGRAIELRVAPMCGGLCVAIERIALERVLLNLVLNAAHAMPTGGVITMRTLQRARDERPGAPADPGQGVTIELRDTGPGIPPEVLARLDEPGFTTRPPGEGSGLGLASVRALLAEAGGWLTIDSTVGQGTRAAIHLPAIPGAPPPPGPARPAPAPAQAQQRQAHGGRKVLLVEDDPSLRRLAARALSRRGWQVVPAASAEAALALFQPVGADGATAELAGPDLARPDADVAALVTDLLLPGLSGMDLAGEVRALAGQARLPVIIVSGIAGGADKTADPATAMLAKPYEMGALCDLLAVMVAADPG